METFQTSPRLRKGKMRALSLPRLGIYKHRCEEMATDHLSITNHNPHESTITDNDPDYLTRLNEELR